MNILFLCDSVYCEDGYEVESEAKEKCRKCPRGTYRTNSGSERFEPCQNCTSKTTDGDGFKTEADCSIRESLQTFYLQYNLSLTSDQTGINLALKIRVPFS